MLKNTLFAFTAFFISIFIAPVFGQNAIENSFANIELKIDTTLFSWNETKLKINNETHLGFAYQKNNPLVEVRFYTKEGVTVQELNKSEQFTITDSLLWVNNSYYRIKLRFNDLASNELLLLTPIILKDKKKSNLDLPLFPYTNTYATIQTGDVELFIGEEKQFEVITNQPENLDIDPRWKETETYEYRFFRKDNKTFFSVIPSKRGEINVMFTTALNRPYLNDEKKPKYNLETQEIKFNVKGSRLSFLRFDLRDLTFERDNVEGYEVQLDNHRNLQLNKTYRLEATDEPGGALVAELFTVRRLSNDKVLCMFRPYNYHRISDSYLFIKDGDEPQFITNINILPEAKINKVSMLREGGTWVTSNQLYPGEKVEVRLEGESLKRAEFIFEGLNDVSSDTMIRSESVVHYRLQVPIDIRNKSINIYNRNKKTGVSLDIHEYQRPRKFDFVIIEYGGAPKTVDRITQPILHNGTIGDVSIQFDPRYIDEEDYLYGKQYLEIEVIIKDNNNILVERYTIDDIVVCPGEDSPRYFIYNGNSGDCLNEVISVNDYISNKTHELDHWSKVELIIRHRKDHYNGNGYSERIEIIKEKLVTFDVDLSIPAGLLIKKVGVDGFPGLTGVSLSMMGQFSFYEKGEIQRLRPYKVGAGFLAKNAFNFNPEADRDLGLVVLGSVYPTKKGSRFSFPLYAGFGYFLNEERFFYLIGPGIQINF